MPYDFLIMFEFSFKAVNPDSARKITACSESLGGLFVVGDYLSYGIVLKCGNYLQTTPKCRNFH